MIWYLLYPFRGTTEAPILDSKHPLRHVFTRHGTYAAHHPVITLLISVAAAVILIYPFPFLYTNDFANGSSNLPHHVWTSAQPYEGKPGTTADVAMRSVWVHGSYMKALDPDVLQSALKIQDHLLGSTINFNPYRPDNRVAPGDPTSSLTLDMRDSIHAINGLSNESWFFHSPLQYWGCSPANIADDRDIVSTVNQRSRLLTSVNVTLRHSIVFSGKRFEDHRLVAADALVITLIHMLDSPMGRQWEKRAEELAQNTSGQWQLYPKDGRSTMSTLYDFRFQPLSLQDDFFLAIAYTFITIYFFLSLSKLRALKSRLGLIVAVIAQILVSILSSFTICAIFKIDLSRIPRELYPIVILTVGLENIFRLINAVIMTPSESPTASRMGEALGLTGHVALAGAAQNLAILWAMSKVFPVMQSWCVFAAIALTFDFFYLLTFFTAVLSVDVRRIELNDSLNRGSRRDGHLPDNVQRKRQTWTDAILDGTMPSSTRVAGTIVIIGFVLMAQWHFFDNETLFQTVSRFFRFVVSEAQGPRNTSSSSSSSSSSTLSVDIHQARTPTAWLRLQDHETAHEVISVIKPKAKSYIARVYEPLVFVMDGSDRTPNQFGVRPFLPAAYDFARNQFGVFLVTVVVTVAIVSLLMNYLLWDEFTDDGLGRPEDDPLVSVKTLSRGHTLDVMLLEASRDGVLATVGLDRWIRIWDVRNDVTSYIVRDTTASNIDPFPVIAIAIDNDSNWLALLSAKDHIYLWSIPEKRWGPSMDVKIRGRPPVSFAFGYDKTELIDPVIIVRQNGLMSELRVERAETCEVQICRSPLVCVRQHMEKPTASHPNPPPRVITSSRKGCVHVATRLDDGWVSEGLEIPDPEDDKEILSIVPLPALSSFLAVRDHTVDLVDIFTHKVTHTFATKAMKKDSLRCFHSTRRRPQCGSVGLASLALAYTCAETGHCVLQSYLPERHGDTICFRDPYTPGSKTCCLWRETVEHRYVMENPGQWLPLNAGYLVGVRKHETSPSEKTLATNHFRPSPINGIRRRGPTWKRPLPQDAHRPAEEEEDVWEVWSLSARGESSITPLFGYAEHDHLLIGSLGPMRKIGKRSMAVAMGNVVKVITVGQGKFDSTESSNDDAAFVGMVAASNRRKRSTLAPRRCH